MKGRFHAILMHDIVTSHKDGAASKVLLKWKVKTFVRRSGKEEKKLKYSIRIGIPYSIECNMISGYCLMHHEGSMRRKGFTPSSIRIDVFKLRDMDLNEIMKLCRIISNRGVAMKNRSIVPFKHQIAMEDIEMKKRSIINDAKALIGEYKYAENLDFLDEIITHAHRERYFSGDEDIDNIDKMKLNMYHELERKMNIRGRNKDAEKNMKQEMQDQ